MMTTGKPEFSSFSPYDPNRDLLFSQILAEHARKRHIRVPKMFGLFIMCLSEHPEINIDIKTIDGGGMRHIIANSIISCAV